MSVLPHYEHIEQEYAGLTREILNSYTPKPGNEIEAVAAIHHNLHTLVDYEQRHIENGASREFRSIPEIIKKGGNCEEKACLQATLLKDYKDIEVKLAVIKNPKGNQHMTTLLKFPERTQKEVLQGLRSYSTYCRHLAKQIDFYFRNDYLFADLSLPHLGQIQWLLDRNYLKQVDDKQCRFNKICMEYNL